MLPFLQLQARLGRKNPSAKILADVPVIFVAWDVLGLDADQDRVVASLLDEPLTERRRRPRGPRPAARRATAAASRSATSPRSTRSTASRRRSPRRARGATRASWSRTRRAGYSPGRRGLGWLKMKKALATLDCVVVGVEVGHGKRHGVLSDYTFAVRDDATGDARDHRQGVQRPDRRRDRGDDARGSRRTRSRTYGRYRAVEPTVVVEVAFDVIMRSARHKSGFALRFPRIAQPAHGQAGRRDRHARHGRPACTRASSTAPSTW